MAVDLKLLGQVDNLTSSIDAYSLAEHSCAISFLSDLKWSLRLFDRGCPNKKKNKKNKKVNKMSSDIGSDPKIKNQLYII